MSRFTHEPIAPGDARDASVVGVTFDAFELASATVNEENLAEEGLSSRSFVANSIMEAVGTVGTSTPTTFLQPFAGTFGSLLTFQVTAGALADSTEWFRILFGANLEWNPGTYASPPTVVDVRTQLRLTYRNGGGGGAGTKITGSEWRRHWQYFSGPNNGLVSAPKQGQQASPLLEGWLQGPVSAGTWVRVEYLFTATDATADVTLNDGRIIVDKFKRVGSL